MRNATANFKVIQTILDYSLHDTSKREWHTRGLNLGPIDNIEPTKTVNINF